MAEKPVKCSAVRIKLYAFLALSERKAQKYAIKFDEGLFVCLNVSRTTKIQPD
jgi:hypothetical protein